MTSAARLILSASLLALAVPAAAQAPVAVAPAAAPAQQSAHERLFQLFQDSDEANLKRNPINALFRGDMRYADRLGDFITEEYYAKEKAASEQDLAALHAIRATSSMRPTSSPTTCSNSPPRTRSRATSPSCST